MKVKFVSVKLSDQWRRLNKLGFDTLLLLGGFAAAAAPRFCAVHLVIHAWTKLRGGVKVIYVLI